MVPIHLRATCYYGFWSKLKKTEIEESDCRLESDEDAIKVLTIHKSKGLQFPVTFIPFSWRTSSGKGLDDKKVRALYVALTRATSRLYLYHKELRGISPNPH